MYASDTHHSSARPGHCASKPKGKQSGLSLVEMCAALAIVSILSCAAWPGLSRWANNARMMGQSQELVGDLLQLRSQAIASNQDLRISVHSDAGGSCYVLHAGGPRDCACSSSGMSECFAAGATAFKTVGIAKETGLSLRSNAASILFDPLLGGTAPGGTIRLIDQAGREIRHIVSLRGRVRACVSSGDMAGHPPC